MIDSEITGNTTNYWGGGIYNASGVVTLNRVTITGNHAGNDGGGIYSHGVGAVLQMTNVTVGGQLLAVASGGGVYTRASRSRSPTARLPTTPPRRAVPASTPRTTRHRRSAKHNRRRERRVGLPRGSFGSLGNNLIGDIGTAAGIDRRRQRGSSGVQRIAHQPVARAARRQRRPNADPCVAGRQPGDQCGNGNRMPT